MKFTTFNLLFEEYKIIRKKYSCNCIRYTLSLRLLSILHFVFPFIKFFKNKIIETTNKMMNEINTANRKRIFELKIKILMQNNDIKYIEEIRDATLRNLNSSSNKKTLMSNCFFYILILAIIYFLIELLKSFGVFNTMAEESNKINLIAAFIASILYLIVFYIYTIMIFCLTSKDLYIYDDLLNDLDYIIFDIKYNNTSQYLIK